MQIPIGFCFVSGALPTLIIILRLGAVVNPQNKKIW